MARRADKLHRSMRGLSLVACTMLAFAAMPFASTPATAQLRMAALGDSLTQGYGLEQGQGLVPQLEAWLREAGHDVTLLNAGVSGDTTAGGLARLDWTLGDDPDAMLVILGGNDLLRGIDPAASRANLDAILARLETENIPAMLVGMPAPGNYGPEFRDAFEAMYVDMAERHGTAFFPNLLQPITEKYEQGLRFSDLMQDDRVHPNAAGVAAIVAGLGPAVAAWLEGLERSQQS